MNFVSSRKARAHFGVTDTALRDWANKGKIECIRTEGGHRRFKIPVIDREKRSKYIYARVSSAKQSGDLKNQIKYAKKKYPHHIVISDIGSGINFKRKGFRKILEKLFNRSIKEVVVTKHDRFARIGTELFEWLFEYFGAKITVIDDKQDKSQTQELAEDLMEIITVFTARYYGQRKYNTEDQVFSDTSSDDDSE